MRKITIIFSSILLLVVSASYSQSNDSLYPSKFVLKTSLNPLMGPLFEYSETEIGLELRVTQGYSVETNFGYFFSSNFNKGEVNVSGYSLNIGTRKYFKQSSFFLGLNWKYENFNLDKIGYYINSGNYYGKNSELQVVNNNLMVHFGTYFFIKKIRLEAFIGAGYSRPNYKYKNLNNDEINQIRNRQVEGLLDYNSSEVNKLRVDFGIKIGICN